MNRSGFGALVLLGYSTSCLAVADSNDLFQLSLEDLMAVKVELASRSPESIAETAAAISVLTRDDIRRSAANSLPELLRLVPGLYVTRLDAGKWAVSIRGFHGRFSNKLLVMMDGRTLYTPLFSGVYWDAEEVYLPDIERIEVIRGPGGSLWGSNAVNGIINIVTRHAGQTEGLSVEATAGDTMLEQRIGARYGFDSAVGPVRFYAQDSRHDGGLWPDARYGNNGFAPVGSDAFDDWQRQLAGFRHDGEAGSHRWQLQGQWLDAELNQIRTVRLVPGGPLTAVADTVNTDTAVLQGRYQQSLADGELQVSAFIDQRGRDDASFDEERQTRDLDLQYQFTAGADSHHHISTGIGWRESDDEIIGKTTFLLLPTQTTEQRYSAFLNDRIQLQPDRWIAEFGIKIEKTEYTDWEHQPSARLLWTPAPMRSFWLAATDVVRLPSRSERDAYIVPPGASPIPLGNPNLDSEQMRAFEFGWREGSQTLSSDVALFQQHYTELISGIRNDPVAVDINGLEWEVRWQPSTSFNLVAFATWYDDDRRQAGQTPLAPRHSHHVRLAWQSPWTVQLALEYTHNGHFRTATNDTVFGEFDVLDITISTALAAGELALIARNLVDSNRIEDRDASRLSTLTEQAFELRYRYGF